MIHDAGLAALALLIAEVGLAEEERIMRSVMPMLVGVWVRASEVAWRSSPKRRI